ncbi:MAG: nucleotidyltransferase family protein [Rhodospirillum sp.]|nr:nucleotidyltransferase family protein [Rhodospirillum sp.]MCF8487629.1 nucleotidyltransferase family protein [Rhodospirillum sp.]MCF8499233.1 nucleotidyltransferase family protein [Rhodospirillum sp.]
MPHPDGLSAIILAGGLGTRLRSTVGDRPKVLAPVAERPFLDWLLAILAASGPVTEVVLSLGYGAEQVIAHLSHGSLPLPVRWVVEERPLGTAGGALLAARETRTPLALVLNGDTFLGLDIGAMARDHRTASPVATMAVVHQDNRDRYGGVDLDGDRVTALREKAPGLGSGLINAGAYMMARTVLVDRRVAPLSMETDLLPALISLGVAAHRVEGPFLDIGLPDTYAQATALLPRLVPRTSRALSSPLGAQASSLHPSPLHHRRSPGRPS